MSPTIYTVEIPPIHYLLLGLESREFKNENTEIAKNEALLYLTKVFKKAFKKKVIEIWDFENENNSNLIKIVEINSPNFMNENGTINFDKILGCKIIYAFNKYIVKDAVFKNKGGKPNDILDSYGFLELIKTDVENLLKFSTFKIMNDEKLQYIRNPNKPINYFTRLKMMEAKEMFFEQKNFYQKDFIKSESYLEFEKIYLSFLNTFHITKFLFVPKKYFKDCKDLITIFEEIYPCEIKFAFNCNVMIEDINYHVLSHGIGGEKFTYSKAGKLFVRNIDGVKEVDEKTTFSDILKIPTNNQDLKNILKFI